MYNNPLIALGQKYREFTHVKKFMRALASPREAQEKKLLEVIRANENAAFGRRYDFASIKSIEDYQKAVPAAEYEDLAPYIEAAMAGKPMQLTRESPLMFATTSGTTGKPKFIPITPAHLRDYTHAFQIHNWGMMRDHVECVNVPDGRYLIFNSNDLEGVTSAGIPYGAVSGLLRRRQSPLVQRYFALPHLVSRIKDVKVKYYVILRLALVQRIVAILACNPSSLLLLADQMNEHDEDLIRDIFDGTIGSEFRPPEPLNSELNRYLSPDPRRARALSALLEKHGELSPKCVWEHLKLMSMWKGGPMPFYLERIPGKFGDVPIRDFGYMASEGRGTIPMNDDGAGGVAALTSHFFEFVPEDQIDSRDRKFLTLDELEMGGRYYIFFTTSAGLYRYNINDVMQVTGFDQQTPVLAFIQKGGGISSITGEKLTEEQVHVALRYAVRQLDLSGIDHFTLAVQLGHPPHYTAFVELRDDISDSVLEAFARVFDQSLQLQNIEYKDKRESKRLGATAVQVLPSGTFTRLRQMRVQQGAPEAQVKIPFLTAGTTFKETLQTLVR